MLPMVPKKNLPKIKLNHLKLYQNDISVPDSTKNSKQNLLKRKTTKFGKKTSNRIKDADFGTDSDVEKKR